MKYFYFLMFIVVGCSTGPRQPTMFMTMESEEETAPPMRSVETPRSQGNSPQPPPRTQSAQPESPGNRGQLPSCPGAYWTNCVGTVKLSSGVEYVGEWRDGQANGQGIEYGVDGSVLRSGIWENGVFIRGR